MGNAYEGVDPDDAVIEAEVVSSEIIIAQDHAALDVAVATAKQYPRVMDDYTGKLEAWCTSSVEVATMCCFAVSKGRETILGPSARYAEMVAVAWGNLVVESRVLEKAAKYVRTEGTARDLEQNVTFRSQVDRPIVNRQGIRYQGHMVDTTAMAGLSIARRNAIFLVVPRALWLPMWEKSRVVAAGTAETFDKRRKGWVAWFKKQSIPIENVEFKLNDRRPNDWNGDDLVVIGMAVDRCKARQSTLKDEFPAPALRPEPGSADEAMAESGAQLAGLGKKQEDDEKPALSPAMMDSPPED